jgi:hypothetical protein
VQSEARQKPLFDSGVLLGSLELVARLQGLPLALNQAGSYMRKTNTTVTEYIELYEQEWSRLMAKQHAFASCENTDRSILNYVDPVFQFTAFSKRRCSQLIDAMLIPRRTRYLVRTLQANT